MLRFNSQQLFDAICFTLDYPFFHYQGVVMKQVQGAPMGSPLAPMLCNAAILQAERQWNATRRPFPNDTIIACYVDYILSVTSNPSFQPFPADFYGSPIELEQCKEPDNFSGLRLSKQDGNIQCSFMTDPALWKYINPCSAGQIQRKLQGLQARLCLARQLSFPSYLATRSMVQLVRIYIHIGYTKEELQETITKFHLASHFSQTW